MQIHKLGLPFSVNHICYPLLAFTRAKCSKKVYSPSLPLQRDKGLKNRITLQRDNFKIRPTANKQAGIGNKLTCPYPPAVPEKREKNFMA